jgi:hypothetical protein
VTKTLGAVVMVVLWGSSAGYAQERASPTETEVREVLETSAIKDVLGSLADQTIAAFNQAVPSLSAAVREQAAGVITEAFALDRL